MRLVKLNNKMKTNTFCLLVLTSLISWSTMAQRGVRIGYIDTEYILQNVPEYQEANTQLESKVVCCQICPSFISIVDAIMSQFQQQKIKIKVY